MPHGVPSLPLVSPDTIKPSLGLAPGPVILSFGLLGPGKGYETVIEAMPSVIAADPAARYVVLGATHPELLRREGEAYRARLMRLADALGVSGNVLFVDRYVTRAELGTWLEAADIFVTPYPNREQIVSGTLAYAMSAGKAIVSTPYPYAVEMLEGGRGRLVADGSSKDFAEVLSELLLDPDARSQTRPAGIRLQPSHDLARGRRPILGDLLPGRRHRSSAGRTCRTCGGGPWLILIADPLRPRMRSSGSTAGQRSHRTDAQSEWKLGRTVEARGTGPGVCDDSDG